MNADAAKRFVVAALALSLIAAAVRDLAGGSVDKVRGGARSYFAIGLAGGLSALLAEVFPTAGAIGGATLLVTVGLSMLPDPRTGVRGPSAIEKVLGGALKPGAPGPQTDISEGPPLPAVNPPGTSVLPGTTIPGPFPAPAVPGRIGPTPIGPSTGP